MATREVEVFRCWDDKTWDTDVVTIEDPGDDQDEEVEKRAVCAGFEALRNSADLPWFVGVYCDYGRQGSEEEADEVVEGLDSAERAALDRQLEKFAPPTA